ncbi:MAG: HlyD family type I secretion periplasmic adaptor subunit [Sphingomonas sp.]|jgi:HlyD family type I secretion membrane fusion protein|uniref:HlyD family type I secretion periplasmic adaptor subunit n=1 Tax=Sphingomonas sp. TaxID=28214 RepID=UPI0035645770
MNAMTPVPRTAEEREALATALTRPIAPAIRRLAIGLGLAVTVIILWGTLVPIMSGVVAQGRVAVESKRKTVQHLDGGIVKQIAVRDGTRVKAGQLLIQLNDGDAGLQVQVLQARADSLRAEQAAREAELAGRDSIAFPPDLLARASSPSVQAAIATQRAAFGARKAGRGGQETEIDQKLVQFGQDVQGSTAQSTAGGEQLALLEREIRDTSALVEKGYATRPRLLALQRAAAQLRGEQHSMNAQAERARAQIAEARIARRQVGREGGVTAAEALRSVQSELVEVTEKLSNAREVLARKRIVAPVDGTVVGLAVTTVGGVVRPGEPLLDIVPVSPRLVVEAQLTPAHADDVRPGQRSFVRLEAGGSRTAPVVEGTVRTVSADALTDQRTGERYFTMIVEITPSAHVPASLVKPGLPASVLVRTGERTLFGYLLEPINRVTFEAMRE